MKRLAAIVVGIALAAGCVPEAPTSKAVAPCGRPNKPTCAPQTIRPTAAPTIAITPAPVTAPPTVPTSTFRFADEFDGETLDTSKWRVSNYGVTGGGRKCCGGANHANYANEVSVGDGYLHVQTHLIGSIWHTGTLDTETKQLFTGGIIEARLKVPAGLGLWPAFWLYDASGEEIDALEVCAGPIGSRGGNDVTLAHMGIHRDNTSPRVIRDYDMGIDQSIVFHTYRVEWRSDAITFSIDGVQRGTPVSPSLTRPMPLILNLGVGGTWCGEPDGTTPTAAEMLVDWVHVLP